MVNTYTVTRLVPNTDMRGIHKSRMLLSRGLTGRQVALAINANCTIIRLVTANGGICQWYADSGRQFDMDEIQKAVASLSLRLTLTSKQRESVRKTQAKATERLLKLAS